MNGATNNGLVVWLTGLPAAGKSTLASAVRERLLVDGVATCVLDSDEIRDALHPKPGYGKEGRVSFYYTVGNLAALLARQGLVVLVAATANLRHFREQARARAPEFVEVYVDASVDVCAQRDIKGLYRMVRNGEISGLPGMDAEYQAPESPDVVAHGGLDTDALERLVALIHQRLAS